MMPNQGKGEGEDKGKAKETPDQQQQNNPERIFPRTLVIQILSHLPVKSLLRFMNVCKEWRSIISKQKFITSHLNNSSSSLLIQSSRFVEYLRFVLKSPTDDAEPEQFQACPHNSSSTFPESPVNERIMCVVGVINGIICLNNDTWDEGFVLWNPATKQVEGIKPTDTELLKTLPAQNETTSFGFGYDPEENHFKIIKIMRFQRESDVADIPYVCPVNTGVWRKINTGQPWFWVIGDKCDTIVNGFPCWQAWTKSGEIFITCFDPVSDLFIHIPMPEGRKEGNQRLVEYKNSLAMVAWDDSDMSLMEFLVWEEKDWSEMYHIDIGFISGVPKAVLGCWNSSELILETDNEEILMLYNIENNRRRSFCIAGSKSGFFQVFDFSETLVSFTADQNNTGGILPRKLVFQILSHLPVKSLLRFRSVCEAWQNLISNPKFIASHLNNSSSSLLIQTNPLPHHLRFVLQNPTDAEPEQLPACPRHSFLRKLIFTDDIMSVVGVINGIICLSTPTRHGGFFLWNPATKQVKCIEPMDTMLFENLPEQHKTSLGFGYDPVGNHFMIIKILGFLKASHIPDITHVCSVDMGIWRKLDLGEPERWVIGDKCDTIVEGFPCWRAWVKEKETFLEKIACFDLVENTFMHIPMPSGRKEGHQRLVEYKNSLAMVAWDDSNMYNLDFWVTVGKEWHKKFHIVGMFGIQRMVGCWRSSEVFLELYGGILMLYNIETKHRKCFRIDGSTPGFFEVFDLSETLVSITRSEHTIEGLNEKTEPALEPSLRR